MSSSWIRVGLKSNDPMRGVLSRDRKGDTQRDREEGQVEREAKTGPMLSGASVCQGPRETRNDSLLPAP